MRLPRRVREAPERAAEAIRLAEKERARAEAEAKKPEVERAPLPPAQDSAPSSGRINPSSIDDFLRSLQGTE